MGGAFRRAGGLKEGEMLDEVVSLALIGMTLALLTALLGVPPLAATVLAVGLASAGGLVVLADRADALLRD